MRIRNLFESTKVAVVAFGRLNPPTIGHEKLVNKIKNIAGDHYLFLSHTQKPKTDPLAFDDKVAFAQKFFPGITVGHQSVRTPIQMLQMLEQQGYTDIVYVAGSDRVESFTKLFNDYNGKEYNFRSISVVSAGERDPDADGAEGMSASKMRAAAVAGDYDSFESGTPDSQLAKQMYDAVRNGMGVKESAVAESSVVLDKSSLREYIRIAINEYLAKEHDIEKLAAILKTLLGKTVTHRGKNYQVTSEDINAVLERGSDAAEPTASTITPSVLKDIERYADQLFAAVGIDVEFTRHFLDRANDPRNRTPITPSELEALFKKAYTKWGKKIAQLGPDAQAVIKDMESDINMPFVLYWDREREELDLIAKTVMRKKNFATSNQQFTVEQGAATTQYYYDVYTVANRKIVKLDSLNQAEYPDTINSDLRFSTNRLAALIVRRSDGKTIMYDAVGDKWVVYKKLDHWEVEDHRG
jgi:hypothetical protein